MIEFLQQNSWVIWVILILVFLVIETLSLEFTFLMLALGSTGGLISSFTPLDFWAQVVIAAVLTLLLLASLRPQLLKSLKKGADNTPSNISALLGLEGRVLYEVTEEGGQVKLNNGETWTAKTKNDEIVPAGSEIQVLEVAGAAVVVTANRKENN